MSELDLGHIRETAEKAEQAAWKLWGMSVMADRGGNSNVDEAVYIADTHDVRYKGPRTFNASHICTMDPATTLTLLDRLEDVEKKLARVVALVADDSRHMARWINDSHLIDVSDLRTILQ